MISFVARRVAPCLLLLDNIDRLFSANEGENGGGRTSHKALDRILSTLLVEIDGLKVVDPITKPKVIVVVTATNSSLLDRSLLRPGRLEERIAIKPPAELQVCFLSTSTPQHMT